MAVAGLARVGILAADATPPSSWISYLLNGGPFAVIVLLLILDKLTTPGERDRLRVENARLAAQVDTLNANIRNEIVPALTENNRLTAEVVKVLSDDDRLPPTGRRR